MGKGAEHGGVLLGLQTLGVHGLGAGGPVGRAHLTVNVGVLEGLGKSQGLIGVSSDGQVADANVSDNALVVDDVGGSEGDTFILNQAPVAFGDALGQIGEEGELHVAETALVSGLLAVLHVGILRVHGASQEFDAGISELLGLVAEGDDFGGADEGEVEGPEEEDDVLASVVLEADLLEVGTGPGLGGELGGGLSDGSSGLVVAAVVFVVVFHCMFQVFGYFVFIIVFICGCNNIFIRYWLIVIGLYRIEYMTIVVTG